MENLEKKLKKLENMFNEVKASIKMPKPNSPNNKNKQRSNRISGNAPKSKKDPEKVAEQIKDGDLKPQAVQQAKELKETFKIRKNGQWSMKS